MISIRNLLEKRAKYPITSDMDSWLEKVLNEDIQKDVWLVTVSKIFHSLGQKKLLERVKLKYHIAGVYNLSTPFYDTGIQMELLHLTNTTPHNIDIAVYKGRTFIYGQRDVNKYDELFTLPERFSSKYENYLSKLELWINGGSIPNDDELGEYEYNSIATDNVEEEYLFPEYYSKQAIKVRKLLEHENSVKLKEVADIFLPRPVNEKTGKVAIFSDLKYPFNPETIEEKTATSVILQKNDIILSRVNNSMPFLIIDDLNQTVYANRNMYVIRCKNIQPEYLFLYLGSDTYKNIYAKYFVEHSAGSVIPLLNRREIENIPVILPTNDEEYYSLQADILTHTERNYKLFPNKGVEKDYYKKEEKIEDILSLELSNKIKIYSNNQLQEKLRYDFIELNNCFKVKAYKATLILAGSILEAILIDWLSEIKGEDYFTNDYKVRGYDGEMRNAVLSDYINEIKVLEQPHWIKEAEHAHKIRKKRNLVHAKLGINSDEINEKTCKMVIGYLKDVIVSRGIEE